MEIAVSEVFNFHSFIESKKSEYAESLVKASCGRIQLNDALEFVNILMLYTNSEYSKKTILKEFEFFTNYIVRNNSMDIATYIISFFIDVLSKNDIITDIESNIMKDSFIERITTL